MPEVSSTDAGRIIGVSQRTIVNYVDNGVIEARRMGLRKVIRIDIDELRRVAQVYQYRFDEDLATQLAK
jgi:hypothetical protein